MIFVVIMGDWDWDWDLGGISLKTWDQSIESLVSVLMFETKNLNSQYQSHILRPKTKSLSLKDETRLEKSQP